MKTFYKTSLPERIDYNGKIWTRNYYPEPEDKKIMVKVLSRRLRGKKDLHGKPYKPTEHIFTELDLFEIVDELPQEVQDVVNKYCTGENSYEICAALVSELEAVGYTCEYGLDAEPHSLKKINK